MHDKLIQHLIIVDTSILWCDDKSLVVEPKFDKFWVTYSKKFSMDLVVPEIVKGEIIFQQTTSANKALKKAIEHFDKFRSITGLENTKAISEHQIRQAIESRFDKWLLARAGTVAKTPVGSINWDDLIQRAIWRKAPFIFDEKKEEKGFRDALILETVAFEAWKPKDRIRRIFLCKDSLLRETAKERQKLLQTYSTIDEFESYLKLMLENLEEQYVRSIMDKANAMFFSKKDHSSLYYKEKIGDKIAEKFSSKFDKMLEWEPVDAGIFYINNAQFRHKLEDNIYVWLSKIEHHRKYRKGCSPTDMIRNDISNEDLQKVQILNFNVHWKCKVESDNKLTDLCVEDIKFEGESFEKHT